MKNILITGCGSGLGRKAAIALANREHFVYATTHTQEQADHLNKLNKKWCLPMHAFKLDIRNLDDRHKVRKLNLDILIQALFVKLMLIDIEMSSKLIFSLPLN